MSDLHLYWIRLEEHTDPHTEGYVGISNDISRRSDDHQRTTNWMLKKGIKSGAKMVILESGLTKKQARARETEMRPTNYIGWNIAEGGNMPPNRKGHTQSPEERAKKSAAAKRQWADKDKRKRTLEALRSANQSDALRKTRSENAKKQHVEDNFGDPYGAKQKR